MKMLQQTLSALIVVAALSSHAEAHFKLLSPTPWIVENDLGDPQKAGPCGAAAGAGQETGTVTTVQAGDSLMVEFEETIHHPGWFRISLAEDRNSFADIAFESTASCNYDLSTVPTEAHGNVLSDGIGMDEDLAGPTRRFSEMVTVPDISCDNCTLQIIQVMADAVHSPPGCIYYHCANIKVVGVAGAADAGSSGAAASQAGSSGAASDGSGGASGDDQSAAGAGGTAGAMSSSQPAGSMASGGAMGNSGAAGEGGSVADRSASSGTSSDSGGCSVAGATDSDASLLGFVLVLAMTFVRRRSSTKANRV